MAQRPRRVRRRRRGLLALLVVALAVGVAAEVAHLGAPVAAPGCTVGAGSQQLTLSNDQAANATTIAAEAVRLGLPPAAATVAFSAALQESGLQNLPYGDRDSVGLFQQRPSQGWGPRADLLKPAYAATVFYQRLVQVPNWQQLPAATAAQLVQRSAAPYAYAQWVGQATSLARALTGQTPAALSCVFPPASRGLPRPVIQARAQAELGGVGLAVRGPSARGWAAAAWLVGHARSFGVDQVSYAGRQWTAQSGKWSAARSGPELAFLAPG